MNAASSQDVKMEDSNVLIFGDIGDWYGLNKSNLFVALQGKTSEDVIHFYINSPGGSLLDALDIYDLIKASPAKAVMHLFGLVASAATVIACAGDEIIMTEQALYMVHEASNYAWGNKREIRKQADILEKFENRAVGIYQKATGLSADAIQELLQEESYLEPSEALALGFVHSVVENLEVDFELEVDATNSRSYDYYDYYYKADASGYQQTIYNCISNKIYPINKEKVDQILKNKNSKNPSNMATTDEKGIFKNVLNKLVTAMSSKKHIHADKVDDIVNELSADEELQASLNAEEEVDVTAQQELLDQYNELDEAGQSAFLELLGVEVEAGEGTEEGEEEGNEAEGEEEAPTESEAMTAMREEMEAMKLQMKDLADKTAKGKTTKRLKKSNGKLDIENASGKNDKKKKINPNQLQMYKQALVDKKITKAQYDKFVNVEA